MSESPASPLERLARSLRVRLGLAAAAAAAVALLGSGLLVVTGVNGGERQALDRTLVSRADRAAIVARDALRGPVGRRRPAPSAGRRPPPLLGPADQRLGDDVAIVRIVRDGVVAERLGSIADPGLPARVGEQASTVQAGGEPWRMVQRTVQLDVVVQAAAPQGPLRGRADRLRNRVAFAGVAAVLATLVVAFLLVGTVLRALGRLRHAAGTVAATADLRTRIDDHDGPQEIREVATTLNAMLSRLEAADRERRAALEATRRFAADAGHELRTPLATIGAAVQTLSRYPDMDPGERAAALGDVLHEHRRAVALLTALQDLARGDAAARTDRAPTDLAELAEAAVASVRAAHPGADITLEAPGVLVAPAWPPGLRLAIENLVRNAVRHGRSGGHVVVRLLATEAGTTVLVDDDGPGIPAAERTAVRGRFVRGAAATGTGSGLGLALVEQQAALHDGTLVLEGSPMGGLRARLVLGGPPP